MALPIRTTLVALLLFVLARPVQADFVYWSNPLGGTFGDGANWQGGTKPTSQDEGLFSLNADYQVNFSNNEATRFLTIDAGRVTFDLQNHELQPGHMLSVGQQANVPAELLIQNGTVAAYLVTIAGSTQSGEPGPGTLRVGAGARLTMEGLAVGNDEMGKLYISDGGIVQGYSVDIGTARSDRTGNGFVEVSGEGSVFTVQSNMSLGRADDTPAVLIAKNRGRVSVGSLSVGGINTSTGTVTLQDPGTTLSTYSLTVGDVGTGTVEVLDGASLFSKETLMTRFGTPSGTIRVRGANSTWVNDTDILVGYVAPASIEVTDGGMLQTSTIRLGSQGTGHLQLSGNTSRTKVLQSMTIGGSSLPTAIGTVQVQDGATLSIGQNLTVRKGSTLDVSEGLVQVGDPAGAQISDGLYIGPNGTLTGTGTVNTSVENNGRISFAAATSELTVTGDIRQREFGRLDIPISRFRFFGTLRTNSQAILGGTLLVTLSVENFNSYQPVIGDVFRLLIADQGVVGAFQRVNLPSLPPDRHWNVRYQANDVSLLVLAGPGIAGDYNNNGMVDAADYVIWRDTFGSISDTRADGTGPNGVPDHYINRLDYDFWIQHYGEISASGPGAGSDVVPEPVSLLSSIVAFVGLYTLLYRRARRLASYCAIAVLTLLTCCPPAEAADTIWTFNGDGNWTTAANWSAGEPVDNSFNVFIDDGDTAVTVTLDTTRTIGMLTLGTNDALAIQGTSVSSTLTSASGFTNDGLIRLIGTDTLDGGALLAISSGILTISPTGTLQFQSGGSVASARSFTGDMINNGKLLVDRTATFDKANGQYTNNGLFNVAPTQVLTITNSGNLTNFSATAINGGTYDVAGTFRFPGANIVANQAEIILRGASSQILNDTGGADALANLAAIGPAGALRLFSGRNFAAAGAFTNHGDVELGGGTFTAPSLTNAAPGEIFGYGTVTPRPGNAGTIRAAGGTLTLTNGVQGGTVKTDPGATLDFSAATQSSSVDFVVHNGANLNLGNNDLLVSKDYNGDFGVGNSYNRRAHVTGTGQILTNGSTNMEVVGGTNSGNTLFLSFARVHVGDSVTKNYQIYSFGFTSLRGAIKTADGGNLTDPRLSGAGVTASNFGPLGPNIGNTGNLGVTFNATFAGNLSNQKVRIVSNFDNIGDEFVQISGTAYRYANPSAHTPEPVDFGIIHVGDVFQHSLSITNDVPNDGFSERLNASIGNATGDITANGGQIVALFPGSTNNTSLAVRINTATTGAKSGSATISFTSTGAGTSSLGDTALANQTVNVQAQVNNYAVAGVVKQSGDGTFSSTGLNQFTLNLGSIVEGQAPLSATLAIANTASAPADSLSGALSQAASDFDIQGLGNFSGIAAGDTGNPLTISLDDSDVGTFNGQITLMPRSVNPRPFDQALPNITILLTGQVRLGGDYNLDGTVNAADYAVWRNTLGQSVSIVGTGADGSGPLGVPDGVITRHDFDYWNSRFGAGSGSGSAGSAAVPEPAGLLSCFLAAASLLLVRQSRMLASK